MVGGGQLARMTHQAAIALGQTLRVLAVSPDDPAAQVTPDVVIGAHTDLDALRKAAAGADALTFDHEHVPTELLEKLVADGVNVAPPPSALIHAQDKLVMRRRLEALGAPVPRFAEVTDVADIDAFAERVGTDIVVKTVRGGYDGRGVTLARDIAEAREVAGRYLADGAAVLVEEKVAMRRELAALVARSPFGQGAAWPVVQTVQRDGICVEVIAPAPRLDAELGSAAGQLALRLAERTRRGRGAGGRAVRNRRRPAGGQRARDASAQLRALEHGRCAHESVRAAPSSGAGLSARRHRTDRTGHGDGQCDWRTTDSGDEHGRTAASPVRSVAGGAGFTCTARASGPAARSGTSTS